MKSFGLHVRIRLGGLVMARSVKFLGKLEATLSDQETREGWWEELRDEIKSHARTVCCTHVIGYIETCTIFGEYNTDSFYLCCNFSQHILVLTFLSLIVFLFISIQVMFVY